MAGVAARIIEQGKDSLSEYAAQQPGLKRPNSLDTSALPAENTDRSR